MTSLHNEIIKKLCKYLIEEKHIDRQYLKKDSNFLLRDGHSNRPDVINSRDKLVYEVHVRGERKGEYFNNLPNDWNGVNVFYDEQICPETLIIKEDNFMISQIIWSTNEINFFEENTYYKPILMKNIRHQTKKDYESKPHDAYIFHIFFWLRKQNPQDIRKIYLDSRLTSYSRSKVITLINGKKVRPDIHNDAKKLLYEMHYKGQRKGDNYKLLPSDWNPINVFYDEKINPKVIVIKDSEYQIKEIDWKSNI